MGSILRFLLFRVVFRLIGARVALLLAVLGLVRSRRRPAGDPSREASVRR